jgi:chemotaxis protein MotB
MSSSHGGDSGRWMVSYADFLTLLFVLFVVLYSMGQTDLQKYKQLAQSFQAAFSTGGGGTSVVVDPSINQSGSGEGQEEGQPAPIVIEGLPYQVNTSSEVASELASLLEQSDLSSDVGIENNIEGALVALSEKLLFTPGTLELQSEAYPYLDSLAEMVRPLDNDIKIIGHTDDTPPQDPTFSNNWELSTARAQLVVQYLIDKGIDPRRLIASGRGEYAPIYVNDTTEHRALNSRVEIVLIYPQDVQDVINLELPQPTVVTP